MEMRKLTTWQEWLDTFPLQHVRQFPAEIPVLPFFDNAVRYDILICHDNDLVSEVCDLSQTFESAGKKLRITDITSTRDPHSPC